MSIKNQEILKWIPLLNIIIFIFWFKAYAKNVATSTRFVKNLLKMFMVLIIFHVPRAFLYTLQISDVFHDIAFYMSLYLSLLFMSIIAIKDQKKFLEEQKK